MKRSIFSVLLGVALALMSGCGSSSPAPTPTATLTSPPAPKGPTFNVMDFGAQGDGVADDAPAIGRAFNAADAHNGGIVLLPGGHTYLIKSAWTMKPIRTDDWLGQTAPTVRRTGTITVSGYGATVKYADGIGRVSWLDSGYPPDPWTTQGDLVVQGMVIDNNMQGSPAEVGRVLWLHDGNVENVTVKDVTMRNVTARTTYNAEPAVQGIYMKENFHTKTPGHRAYMRGITILDCDISAQGKPIGIVCDSYGEDTEGWGESPLVVDDIRIERVKTDNNHHLGTGIHLGGHAAGTAVVRDVTCTDSSDNLIEIDAFNDVTVQRAHLSKAQSGIGFTWFSFPYRSTTPVYRILDCDYSGPNDAYWDMTDTTEPPPARNAEGSVFLGALSSDAAGVLLSRTWGDLIITGNSWTNGAVNVFYSDGSAIQAAGVYRKVTISDNRITDIDKAGVGGALVSFRQLGSAAADLTMSGNTYRASLTGSFVPLPSDRISLLGPYRLR